MNTRRHTIMPLLTLSLALAASHSAAAQDSCLQRAVAQPPAHSVSHWVITNVCSYTVKFETYMSGTGGTFNVYTQPLGRLADLNPGFPITIVINAGGNQHLYFGTSSAGSWDLITENVVQKN